MSKKRIALRIVLVVVLVGVLCIGYRAWTRQRPDYYWDKAQAAVQAGDSEAAKLYLQNMVQRAAHDARGHQALAKLYLQEAKAAGKRASYAANPRALGHLAEAAKLRPDDAEQQEQLLAIYLSMGQMQNAAEVATTLIELNAGSSNALFALANQAVAAKNVVAADELLERLNKLPSRHPFQMSLLHIQNHETAGRRAEIPRVLDHVTQLAGSLTGKQFGELAGNDLRIMSTLLLQAVQQADNATIAQQRADNSLHAFETLLDSKRMKSSELAEYAAQMVALLQSEHVLPADGTAEPAASEGLVTRAGRIWDAAIVAGDAPPLVYHQAATAAFAHGKHEAAIENLKKGIAVATHLPPERLSELLDLHLLATRQLMARRRFSEAEKHLEIVLENDATAGLGHLYAGNVALEKGRMEAALNHFLQAQRSLGNTLQVRAALANAYITLRRWNDALPLLASLHVPLDELPPDERVWAAQHVGSGTNIHLNELRGHLALSQWEQAQPHLEALKDTQFETLAWKLTITYLWENKFATQAQTLLADARRKFPRDNRLLQLETTMLEQAGKVDDARQLLEQSATLASDDLESQMQLCDWRIRHGHSEEALRQLEDLDSRLITTPRDQLLVTLFRVQALLALGRPQEALAVIEPLRENPDTAAAAGLIGATAQIQQHNLDKATQLLAVARQADPESGALDVLAGELAATRGDFDQAITALSSSLDVTALRERAGTSLLRSLLMLADQTSTLEAETKVDELLEQHPDDPYLLIAKADFGVRRRDVDAGMMTLDRLEQLRPDSPLPPYLKAMVWHSRSQADRALVELKRALQRRPQHVPSLALASQVSLRLGHDAAALDYAQRALKQNQQLWNGFLLQAEALIRLNRHDEAIPVLQNVVRDQPGFVSGYLALATAYALSGQDEKALNVYREGRQQVHDDSKMALVTAEIVTLARAGRLEEARNVAEQSAGEQPESALCLQLAGAFFSANERDDARRWGEQALELADEKLKGEAHLLLGKIALMEAEVAADSTLLAEARDHFSVVHQLQPANVVAANNLAWLLATHFDQVSEAVKVCEQACENISLAQLPVEFIDTLAVVYRKADRLDDALSVLQDAITHFPNEPIFHFQLGMTLAPAGKKDTAIEALQRALELGLPDKRTTEARRQLAVLQDE